MTEEHYRGFQAARHIARVELRNAAARYGALANRRARPHPDQAAYDRAARDVVDAAHAFVYADQICALADEEVGVVITPRPGA